jgi:probable rRNA maturation factor
LENLHNEGFVEFDFQNLDEFPFPEEQFRKWIFSIIEKENKKPGNLSYIFLSDDELLEMNKQYLDHDDLTDIITFDYSEDFGDISGDIFISIDRVRENANLYSITFLEELARVLAHGVLHICGYGDKSEEDQKVMRDRENHYLRMVDFL